MRMVQWMCGVSLRDRMLIAAEMGMESVSDVVRQNCMLEMAGMCGIKTWWQAHTIWGGRYEREKGQWSQATSGDWATWRREERPKKNAMERESNVMMDVWGKGGIANQSGWSLSALAIPNLEITLCRSRRLRWYGHVKRMEELQMMVNHQPLVLYKQGKWLNVIAFFKL